MKNDIKDIPRIIIYYILYAILSITFLLNFSSFLLIIMESDMSTIDDSTREFVLHDTLKWR